MRITNQMIFGNTLNNVWRNQRHINTIIQSIETQKRIQRPSQDPMLAAQTLRYRNILSETEQFLLNAAQADAWMDSSEASFNNMIQDAMLRIRTLLVNGATGTNEFEDRMAILEEIGQIKEEIGLHMNQTYLGRFVFSGFRTDEPPILTGNLDGIFRITQTFNRNDIERTIAFQQRDMPDLPHIPNINIIKLPYTNAAVTSLVTNTNPPVTINIVPINSADANAFNPPAGVVHHVYDTGELIIPDSMIGIPNTYPDLLSEGFTLVYVVQDLEAGQLNPRVYFHTEQLDENGDVLYTFDVSNDQIRVEVGPGAHIAMNSLAQNIFTANMFSDFRNLIDFANNIAASRSDPVLLRQHFSAIYHYTDPRLEQAVRDHINSENSMIADVMYDRFNNMLRFHEQHTHNAQAEHSNLGARMNRLEMLTTRLEDNYTDYTALYSGASDTPMQEATARRTNAIAAFQASLRANAMIVQLSLADFLR